MSLINQIRIAFLIVILIVASGNLVFTTLDSKHSLESALQNKNNDNANVLALSLSQMEKDPITIELFISAQFDAGHYHYIGLFDPAGQLITERINPLSKTRIPIWFTRILKIAVSPGYANIQSGWQQYGTIHVESDLSYSYDTLWRGVTHMFYWTLAICLIIYIAVGYLLSKIMQPLNQVIDQANAIGERRFIKIREPKTLEFKALVKAMNQLSGRIRETLQTESERLEALRFKSNYDEVTGLMNHDYFVNSVDADIQHEQFNEGAIVILRICNLAEIDHQIGYVQTNSMLKSISDQILTLFAQQNHIICGRVNGRDIAIFSEQPIDEMHLANQVKGCLIQNETFYTLGLTPKFLFVITKVRKIDDTQHLFKALDFMLEISSLSQGPNMRIINANSIIAQKNNYLAEWREQLTSAIEHQRIKLEHFPVVDRQGKLIHYESPVRLQLEVDGKWLTAGEFIEWAIQLDLIKALDKVVIQKAIDLLKETPVPICINISEDVMLNKKLIDAMTRQIKKSLPTPQLISVEVPEIAAFHHLEEFKHFCNKFKKAGCKVGIEHINLRIARIGELYDIGLDYIKFDTSLIRNIHKNDTNKTLLRGLCLIAHSIGVQAIGEGVHSEEEASALLELGMDGLTGPAIRLDNTKLK